jgi:hypothetical protein
MKNVTLTALLLSTSIASQADPKSITLISDRILNVNDDVLVKELMDDGYRVRNFIKSDNTFANLAAEEIPGSLRRYDLENNTIVLLLGYNEYTTGIDLNTYLQSMIDFVWQLPTYSNVLCLGQPYISEQPVSREDSVTLEELRGWQRFGCTFFGNYIYQDLSVHFDGTNTTLYNPETTTFSEEGMVLLSDIIQRLERRN